MSKTPLSKTPLPKTPSKPSTRAPKKAAGPVPTPVGGYILASDPIEINPGRPRTKVTVRNTGDRPIQVGSHFHFFETNRSLEFDRAAAFGQRLDIPANTAVRFEPGDEKDVTLVPFAGKQFINGFNGLVDGWTGTGPSPGYNPNRDVSIAKAAELGFKSRAQTKKSAK